MRHFRDLAFIVVGLVTCLTGTPAMATWHINEEGEFFSDFDAPDAQRSFDVYPAGIYEPSLYFAGSIDWAGDRSDTIVFRMGDATATGLALKEFRAGFQIDSSIAIEDSGIEVLLRPLDSMNDPILQVSEHAATGAGGSIVVRDLPLASGRLYALTFSLLGNTDPSIRARYAVGFTIVESVPEPSTALLLAAGGGLVAFASRQRLRRSDAA